MENDVALVQLRDRLSFENIKYNKIPLNKGTPAKEDDSVYIYGYGTSYQNYLEIAFMKVENQEKCKREYELQHIFVTDKQFCLKVIGADAEIGDSGGPVVKLSDYTQVGIISYGHIHEETFKVDENAKPGVYVDVKSYYPWIIETIKAHTPAGVTESILNSSTKTAFYSLGLIISLFLIQILNIF